MKLICSDCQKSCEVKPTKKGQPRTPAGWKHVDNTYNCSECWGKKYILRAITMPVVSPVDSKWEDIDEALKVMWRETTRCSNWMITQCYARDVRREPGVEKMPPMPRLYLYPEARGMFPSIPPQSVASIEQSIQRRYRKLRYEIVWTCGRSLPSFRYPTPFPVHNQSWDVDSRDEFPNAPIVSVRIAGSRYALRLKGGSQMRRQLAGFKQLSNGSAHPGELAIFRKGLSIMVKMVAWLPRVERKRELSGALIVKTAPDALMIAVDPKGQEVWRFNGDHIRRWVAEHRSNLQRWAEDSKCENRPVPSFTDRRTDACRKFSDRMSSACHEAASYLEGYAERGNFAVVRYDNSCHSFCPEFQWAKLRSLIIEKLDAFGIRMELASGQAAKESPESLAG